MNKKIILLSLLILFSLSFFIINSAVVIAPKPNKLKVKSATTRVVNQTPACWQASDDFYYSKIQEAVDAAVPGDEIVVCYGEYEENIVIPKEKPNLIIWGYDKVNVNASNPDYHVFDIKADNTELSAIEVKNAYNAAGIHLNGVKGSEIDSVWFFNNTIGILLSNSNSNSLGEFFANYIHDNEDYGIRLVNSNNNIIFDGTEVMRNGIGISLENSNNNLLSPPIGSFIHVYENKENALSLLHSNNNTINIWSLRDNGGDGISLNYSDSNTISAYIVSNNSNGMSLIHSNNNVIKAFDQYSSLGNRNNGIRIEDSNNTQIGDDRIDISGSGEDGIFILNSNNVTTMSWLVRTENNLGNGIFIGNSNYVVIKDSSIRNNDEIGINISNSNNVTINSSIIRNNTYHGILLNNSSYTIIQKASIYNNSQNGISLSYSNNTIIKNNTIYNNSQNGIYLRNSNNTILRDSNIISNGHSGIFSMYSNNTIIENNEIKHNLNFGIYSEVSPYTKIEYNLIYDNTGDGIYLDSSSNNNITYLNTISHNYNGIHFFQVTNSTIEANTIFNNTRYGIFFRSSDQNNITSHNIISLSQFSGILLDQDSDYNIISNNSVHHNARNGNAWQERGGIFLDGHSDNNTIFNNLAYLNVHSNPAVFGVFGIGVWHSDDNKIIRNNIYDNGDDGINLCDADRNKIIDGNDISSDRDDEGIHLYENTNYNQIRNNTIHHNRLSGIALGGGRSICTLHGLDRGAGINNVVENNIIYNNGEDVFPQVPYDAHGIQIGFTNHNIIINNRIYTNIGREAGTNIYRGDGIWLYASLYNNITNNIIYANARRGIRIQDSLNNNITNNTIRDHPNQAFGGAEPCGVWEGYSLPLFDTTQQNESGNTITNNFNDTSWTHSACPVGYIPYNDPTYKTWCIWNKTHPPTLIACGGTGPITCALILWENINYNNVYEENTTGYVTNDSIPIWISNKTTISTKVTYDIASNLTANLSLAVLEPYISCLYGCNISYTPTGQPTITPNCTYDGSELICYDLPTEISNETVFNSLVITTPPVITILSPENKTYSTIWFWANISLNKAGSMALYSLDGATNQTLTKLNDKYFYKNITTTEGSHNIIFYANDTSGNMEASSRVYFTISITYSNSTTYLSESSIYLGDSVNISCLIRDVNTSLPIADYYTEIYVDAFNLTAGYSDTNGWFNRTWIPRHWDTYTIKCAIYDDPSYHAIYNDTKSLTVSSPTTTTTTTPTTTIEEHTGGGGGGGGGMCSSKFGHNCVL